MFDLSPLRTELAIRPALFVGEELLLADAVVTFLLVFVDSFFVEEALENSLHTFLVRRIGRGGPTIVTDFKFLPKGDESRRDLIDELLGRDARLLRRLLHLLAVLIDAGEEENRVAFQPMITRDDIGEHLLVGMANVRRAVGVVDRGGDVERFGHRARRYCWRRLRGATASFA